METADWPGGRLAVFLARLPPFADLFRMRGFADVEDDKDLVLGARIAGREISVFPSRIGIAMRASGSAAPARDLFRIHRIADVPKDHIGSVSGLTAVERGNHQVVMDRDLRGDPILRPVEGYEFDELRISRVGDVQDAPAKVERMAHIEIPTPADRVVERHLEGAIVTAKGGEADYFDVLTLAAGWN